MGAHWTGHRWWVALVAAGLLVAGCGSGTSTQASTPPPTPTPTTSASASSGGSDSTHALNTPAATRKTIEQTYVSFFSGKTPAGQKVSLVQDGKGFAQVIHKQAGSPIAKGTTVKVSKVSLDTDTTASVRYTIFLAGKPALKDQKGLAVRDHGTWKVGAGTFCTLLGLEGSAPPLCKAG